MLSLYPEYGTMKLAMLEASTFMNASCISHVSILFLVVAAAPNT